MGHLLPLSISKTAADTLYIALRNIIPDEAADLDFDGDVNQMQMLQVTEAVKNFETVFAAELQTASTYFVQQ
jgi:hypothetical protein